MVLALVVLVYFLVPKTSQLSEHPKVLLISFDGFRYDLLNQTMVPNIQKWAEEEATWFVNGVLSQHITYTAPNHLSIVTGLFEESHGATGNRFFLEDGVSLIDYYGGNPTENIRLLEKGILKGDPIWLTNERAASTRRSTVIKWPFSEAIFEQAPHRPTHFEPWSSYGSLVDFKRDVDAVVAAFTDKSNPSNFVAWYVDQPDAVLHQFGFHTGHLKRVISELDVLFGYFLTKMTESGLIDKVNVILTADHGHAEVIDYKHVLCIRDFVEGDFRWGDLKIYPDNDTHAEEIYKNLTRGIREKGMYINIYKTKDFPDRFHYKNNLRSGGIIIEPAIGFAASFRCTTENQERKFGSNGVEKFHSSTHGQSPDNSEMRALLVMSGPEIKKKLKVEATPQNVDLYPLICRLLEITPSRNNGSWSIVGAALEKAIYYHM